MCASPLDFLRSGPPPPRVAILSDAVFFSRAIPVRRRRDPGRGGRRGRPGARGALAVPRSPSSTSATTGRPGAPLALAFAAYRRRFTAEQVAEWTGAQHVMPAFAAILGAEPSPATTVLLGTPEGLTAVHWEKGPVPVAGAPPHAGARCHGRGARPGARRAGQGDGRVGEGRRCRGRPRRPGLEERPRGDLRGGRTALGPARRGRPGRARRPRQGGPGGARPRAQERTSSSGGPPSASIAACLVLALGELSLFGAGLLGEGPRRQGRRAVHRRSRASWGTRTSRTGSTKLSTEAAPAAGDDLDRRGEEAGGDPVPARRRQAVSTRSRSRRRRTTRARSAATEARSSRRPGATAWRSATRCFATTSPPSP